MRQPGPRVGTEHDHGRCPLGARAPSDPSPCCDGCHARQHVGGEPERRDPETHRIGERNSPRPRPNQVARTPIATVTTRLRHGTGGQLLGGGGRHDQQGEHQQDPGDLADLGGRRSPAGPGNRRTAPRTGTPRARATSGSTVAKRSGRPMTAEDARARHGHHEPGSPPGASEMPRKVPNSSPVRLFKEPSVEADEQGTAGQGEGLDRADDGRLLAERPARGGPGHQGDDQRRGDGRRRSSRPWR